MKIRLCLTLLGFACLLSTANSACDLGPGNRDRPFPDIAKYVADTYIMGVEYSVPGARQTDYYTEYYETKFHKGRIDGHVDGSSFKYMYNADNWESWNIELNRCELRNISQMPDFYIDKTEWVHNHGTPQFTTVGPSAMLKVAYDVWQNPKEKDLMIYKGKVENMTIRGEKAVYYRRCMGEYAAAEYFFADEEEQDSSDTAAYGKYTPLRVVFYNLTGEDADMASQFYDILLFQHAIPPEMDPFALPKGLNCTRDIRVQKTSPPLPDFSKNNLLLSSEVLYQRFKIGGKENQLMSSYYSTFVFGIDHEIKHLMYYYSTWNTSKPDDDHQLPFQNMPFKIVYDMAHNYTYKVNVANDKCYMSRDKRFSPVYLLPEGGGGISLTDPYVLFPNNELVFLDKGKERGLTVNVYEVANEDYLLAADTLVPKIIATHSYYTDNTIDESTTEIRSAPTQIQMHLFRSEGIEEVLTFNIFGFTTKYPKGLRRRTFDISRCFKNDDDYEYLTIGFEPDPQYMPELEKRLGDVESRVLDKIGEHSGLNGVRIPYVVSEVKDNLILITLWILDKPAAIMEYEPKVEGKTIDVAADSDKQGVSTFDVCANNCLESRSLCWGFALCGGTCVYGSDTNTKVIDKKGCDLYRRYSNKTAIQSKDIEVNNIVGAVDSGEFTVYVDLPSQTSQVPLKAIIAQVTDPAEDESLFTKMGNSLNPRMRVLKTATKLKKGSSVRNLGKLRYDECQQLCLDFKDCETLSYCLVDADCKLSTKLDVDLNIKDETEPDDWCNLLTRKYADHFDRTPGVFATVDGGTSVKAATVEECARECLKTADLNCMSFDHCAGGKYEGCRLYTTHFKKTGSTLPDGNNNPRCGHYSRKFSAEFKKKDQTRITGGNFQIIKNLTLEECAKRCMEYDKGACYGYDFCQGSNMLSTSCTLFDSDPSRLKTTFSDVCSNYVRTSAEYAPRPYTNSYAGGIGFLCFLVGGLVGIGVVFLIAYIRVNRR